MPEWTESSEGRPRRVAPALMSAQPSLFPLQISSRHPATANGADISFCCFEASGGYFYCKEDKDGRLIRATEWFLTQLARHLGIVTPTPAILEDPISGTTAFGSLKVAGPASEFEARKFLTTPRKGELGQPSEWPGAYLSGLYAFDLFAGNPDRCHENFFVLNEGLARRLCAFDFASSQLKGMASRQFPVASDATVRIGKFLRRQHGFFPGAANEMIDRIAAVPVDTIAGILKPMPDDWMGTEQREGICELWSARRLGGRLMALRTGLADESLL